MADILTTQSGQRAGFRSIEASTGAAIGDAFDVHGIADVATACAAADATFDAYRATDNAARAAFLERIGDEIVALGDELIVTAMRESGLPRARLEGERGGDGGGGRGRWLRGWRR